MSEMLTIAAALPRTARRLTEAEAGRLFGLIFDDYYRHILALAYSVTGDWHASQDIAQETFLKLDHHLHSRAVDGRIVAWTRQVATHAALDLVRRRRCHQRAEQPDEAPEAVADDMSPTPEQLSLCRELVAEIEKLPLGKRLILDLRLWDRLTYEEISRQVGCSEAKARKTFQRVRDRLRRVLGQP